ncbi:MAG: DUF1638 domain-containing protein [Chloroflexi bacterium]|nr:DUF1638 domain-containing protein [Chloroflexota bacterium]
MDYTRTLVMACATVIEEMLPLMPPGMKHEVFDFGLHVNPAKLHSTLQEAIDRVSDDVDTIILGYGLCSQAVIGIKSDRCTLVVPRVDDCIAIFLGSCQAYKAQARTEPGTYYLTKGWIEVGDTPFSEYDRMVKQYGEKRADRLIKIMLGNYKRLALINTGQYEMDKYRDISRQIAERFNLRYEEIEGSNALVKAMLYGQWEDDFVVLKPGEAFRLEHFFPSNG